MEKENIIEKVGKRQAGGFVRVIVKKQADILKKFQNEAGAIEKESRFTVQLCAYANKKDIRESIEAGERDMPVLPAFVEKVEKMQNGLAFWIGKNGQVYLALPTVNTKAESSFFRNGEKVEKNAIAHFLKAQSDNKPAFVTVKLENIAEIH